MPHPDQGGFTPPSSASRRSRAALMAEAVDPVVPTAPITVPIDASGTELNAQIKTLLLQLIPAFGLLLSVLGFSDRYVIVRALRFLGSEPAIPIVSALASGIAVILALIRAKRRQRKLQTLALLPTTPNSIAIGPANPSPAVALAVETATTVIDQQGGGQPAVDVTTGR